LATAVELIDQYLAVGAATSIDWQANATVPALRSPYRRLHRKNQQADVQTRMQWRSWFGTVTFPSIPRRKFWYSHCIYYL
jgi:hypothetical protein